MRVLSSLTVLAACAVVLSGCEGLMILGIGPDPPVHRVDGGASPGRAVASGTAPARVSGVAVGELGSRMTIKHGFVRSTIRNARFFGTFRAAPGSAARLGALADAQWHGRFSGVRDRRNQKIKLRGLVLATFTDPEAGRACLRLSYRNVRKRGARRANRKRGMATLSVLGGEGGAQTLGGSARVRARLAADGSIRISGIATPRAVPARGLNAACTKLRGQFGLAPL